MIGLKLYFNIMTEIFHKYFNLPLLFLKRQRVMKSLLFLGMTCVYCYWAVMPHSRVHIHDHEGAGYQHNHPNLSPYQLGYSINNRDVIEMSQQAVVFKGQSPLPFFRSGLMDYHTHFIEECNCVDAPGTNRFFASMIYPFSFQAKGSQNPYPIHLFFSSRAPPGIAFS